MGERASPRSKYEREGENEASYWETKIDRSQIVIDGMASLVVDLSICIITLTTDHDVHEKRILAPYNTHPSTPSVRQLIC